MNPHRTHDKSIFYKYMSANTALAVLTNHTLRWSSPTEFNDPFDVPRELAHDISSVDIKHKICELIIKFIINSELDISHLSEHFQRFIKLMRSSTNIDITVSTITDQIYSTLDITETLEGLRSMWRSFIPTFRILSLTTKKDAASMWFHYADKFKGVVIGLACMDERDSPWLLARPVDYPVEPPTLFSAEGWAEVIMMPEREAFESLLRAYTYTKTPDWSYEEEWRITSFKRQNETGTISDYMVHPANFSELYFGPLIDKQLRQELLSLIDVKLPHIRAYDVSFGLSRKITFTPSTKG